MQVGGRIIKTERKRFPRCFVAFLIASLAITAFNCGRIYEQVKFSKWLDEVQPHTKRVEA